MERLPLDILHYEVENTVISFAEIRHANGIRVLDRGRGLGFPLEPCDRLALLKIFTVENVLSNGLDRHATGIELFVSSKVNLSHRAPAQTLL